MKGKAAAQEPGPLYPCYPCFGVAFGREEGEGKGMTVEAIKAAIEELTELERRKLADWFEELEEQAWDAEMEADISPGGRGHHLIQEINQEIERCRFTPLEEGLRSRQE